MNIFGIEIKPAHCWMVFRRHVWDWDGRPGGMYLYPWCRNCGWPGSYKLWRKTENHPLYRKENHPGNPQTNPKK
jgi:hypothetical protein